MAHRAQLTQRIARLERCTKYMSDDPEDMADIMDVFRTEAAAEPEQADAFDTGLAERPL